MMIEIERAAECLRAGKLVAFPTETVYGLGADALNAQAVAGIYAAKGRPADHPLIVHGADGDTLLRLARRVPAPAWVLIERFWSGPLTLVLSRAASVPDAVTGGQDTVALRVPDHPLALALLAEFSGPLVAPSTNRFGRISPTTAEHVQEELGSAVDFILDGGPCQVGVESAIVDLSGDAQRLLRPGGVPREAIEALLGRSLAAPDIIGPGCRWLEPPADPAAYARVLYAWLRALDRSGVSAILVQPPPRSPCWEAVRDRLTRAARGSRDIPMTASMTP